MQRGAAVTRARAAVIKRWRADGGSLLKHSHLSPRLYTVYDQLA